jgi:hypothetical protein
LDVIFEGLRVYHRIDCCQQAIEHSLKCHFQKDFHLNQIKSIVFLFTKILTTLNNHWSIFWNFIFLEIMSIVGNKVHWTNLCKKKTTKYHLNSCHKLIWTFTFFAAHVEVEKCLKVHTWTENS